jgi:hypothetical protein
METAKQRMLMKGRVEKRTFEQRLIGGGRISQAEEHSRKMVLRGEVCLEGSVCFARVTRVEQGVQSQEDEVKNILESYVT